MTDTEVRPARDAGGARASAGPGDRRRVPGRAGDPGRGRPARRLGPVRLLRPGRAAQGRGAGRSAGPAAAGVPAERGDRPVRGRGRVPRRGPGGVAPGARAGSRRPAADHQRGLRRDRGRGPRRPGVAGSDGQARPDRRQQDPGAAADRGGVRPGRRPPPVRPGAGVPPGAGARLHLGASRGRGRRVRRPGRAQGVQGRRRVPAPRARRIRRLRRPGGARPAAGGPAADRDHPARRAQLHPGRPPAALAGLVHAGRLRRAGGPDPAPDQPGRRRPGPAGRLPRVHRGTGRAVRRSAVPVLADVFRRGRVPARQVDQLAAARLRLPGRDRVPGRHAAGRLRRAAGDPQRDLHPRGGLRHPLEAHRRLQRLRADPPAAPPGRLVVGHGRQLRLRLLLVLLPGRHDRARGQDVRRAVHRRLPGRR